MRTSSLLPVLIATAFAFTAMAAETAEKKGYRIAKESDDRHANFGDYKADGKMVLMDASGNKSTRKLKTRILEGKKDGDMSIMIFSSPKDIKGTALLTHAHKKGDDDQWLYLPALKRVKRIASSNKTGPFMGSEFSYEDLTPREVDKYKYKYLKQEKCGKKTCHKIQAIPTDKKSAYSRQIIWLDTKDLLAQKVEYFDRKKSHLKTLTASKYQKYNGKHWAAGEMYMENLQTKKNTRFLWTNYKYGNGLNARDFDQNALKRAR